MRLVVHVIEARNLSPTDTNGLSDPYVKLQLGRQKFKTKVVKKSLNPFWGEEFSFRVEDLKEKLVISVLDEDKYFNDDFIGQIKVPIWRVFDADDKCLNTDWYSLKLKNKKSKNKDCGEILLTIRFLQIAPFSKMNGTDDSMLEVKKSMVVKMESPSKSFSGPSNSSSPGRSEEYSFVISKEETYSSQKSFAGRIAKMFNKNSDSATPITSRGNDIAEPPEIVREFFDDNFEEKTSLDNFEDMIRSIEFREHGKENLTNLPGGVLLDQEYAIAPQELNSLLFSPDSRFPKLFANVQGTTELQFGPWKFDNGYESLRRVVTYIKAATKLIKAVKGIEEQTYLKADGKVFILLASVSIPDVMYGSTFKTELLYCIMPGYKLPSRKQTSHLVISWRMNFLQSTMMKGMIENGARQGLKDSFEQFASLLSEHAKPIDLKDIGSSKDQVLASVQPEPQSDWKLAFQYFANLTAISIVLILGYVLIHMWLAAPNTIQGLEFLGLDLPDSVGEVIISSVLVIQCRRMIKILSQFMQARRQDGSDHRVKAKGNGWLLTIALIEGSTLATVDTSGFYDPYVVFTCNGKTRTSSIKFQKSNPLWNEIFEFDAMDEPPSTLDVEVFDFDGPFNESTSLGHAEINFLKSNISDLVDIWVPIQGKLAQTWQSNLHLRIFLDNTKGSNVVKEYLSKMEKEVGKKISLRSPQMNTAFQKLFGLPQEEFLINDFTCHLKRKMPLQGRLFLSARILGFHSNIFGYKTKFFFLWEDIKAIENSSPTLSSMGRPIIVMTLRQGRGIDARHGAKAQDEQGRLKFHFHSFMSFGVAHRTIMALWRARSLSPEQKEQIFEEESETKVLQSEENKMDQSNKNRETKVLQTEESGSILDLEDVALT